LKLTGLDTLFHYSHSTPLPPMMLSREICYRDGNNAMGNSHKITWGVKLTKKQLTN